MWIALAITLVNLAIVAYWERQAWLRRRAARRTARLAEGLLEAVNVGLHLADLDRARERGDLTTADQILAHLRDAHDHKESA